MEWDGMGGGWNGSGSRGGHGVGLGRADSAAIGVSASERRSVKTLVRFRTVLDGELVQ
jgi:hypothetical protein